MDQFESLCSVLGDEARICSALAGVLRDEQQAVVGLHPEAIFACLERRQTLQEELLQLASLRREMVRGAASECGAAPTESATTLLPLLPPPSQVRLRVRLRALRRALLEARGLERQNALLAGASFESAGDLLRALGALVPGARYGADARVAPPAASERVDRRV